MAHPYESVMENVEGGAPFVWTEDAHSLYLSFLEEAFVNNLYLRHFCSPDICGCSPPFPLSRHASTVAAAESPSSAPPQLPSSVVVTLQSKPDLIAERKARCRGPRPSTKATSSKRKGKWPSQDAGFENQQTPEPSVRLQDNSYFLEQPGSSWCSDYVVPKVPRRASKRSRLKALVDGTDRPGADQVVPSEFDQDGVRGSY
ncbi:hypothetical protein L7F22_025488 [Adiantum nelumboides]|nr:hypothetical protein [Adiantum nelumboides]